MERYFLDVRVGCAAIRDREHDSYDPDYAGLHPDTLDVVHYRNGYTEAGTWYMLPQDLDQLKEILHDLNYN